MGGGGVVVGGRGNIPADSRCVHFKSEMRKPIVSKQPALSALRL